MSDREKMIEVISLAKEDFAREMTSYLEFGNETDLIADRLIEAGFEVVVKDRGKCFSCGGDGKVRNHGGSKLWKICDRCNGTGKKP